MILGSAEAISHNNEGFEVLDTKLKFYVLIYLFIIRINRFSKFFSRSKSENKEITNTPKVVENIQNLADQIVLQQFAPASARK
jgi:two-component system CheB/CheR fusion protein